MMQPNSEGSKILALPNDLPILIESLHITGVQCVQVGDGILRSNHGAEAVRKALQQVAEVEVIQCLDYYILVLPRDLHSRQLVADMFFSYIALDYELAVDIERNRDNILKLLIILKYYGINDSAIILDYGCGTGLSLSVSLPTTWRIVGVDRCPLMQAIAAVKGMQIITPVQLYQNYQDRIDAAFCSYVFHIVFDLSDLDILWTAIKTGGVVVANFHKGIGEQHITDYLTARGARVEIPPINYKHNHGLYRAYIK